MEILKSSFSLFDKRFSLQEWAEVRHVLHKPYGDLVFISINQAAQAWHDF